MFAFHPPTSSALVVEVKSVVPDSQAMLFAIDRKVRLAGRIAVDRGWRASSIASLLVIGDSSSARDRIAALDATYRARFPVRGRAVRTWLQEPVGAISGLLFVRYSTRGSTTNRVTGRERVRRPVRGCNAIPEGIGTARPS